MSRPLVIALVGIDGAGKTTQAEHLARALTATGIPATRCSNPGGRVRLGRIARRLGRQDADDLLGRGGALAVESTVRWGAILWGLLRTLPLGRTAVMDRYSYCQFVSVRVRGGHCEGLIRFVYRLLPDPDVVCWLVLSPESAMARIDGRGTDTEELGHLRALAREYLTLPEAAGFRRVDAEAPPDQVHEALRALVLPETRPGPGPAP
jgi:dTMP kinase